MDWAKVVLLLSLSDCLSRSLLNYPIVKPELLKECDSFGSSV